MLPLLATYFLVHVAKRARLFMNDSYAKPTHFPLKREKEREKNGKFSKICEFKGKTMDCKQSKWN